MLKLHILYFYRLHISVGRDLIGVCACAHTQTPPKLFFSLQIRKGSMNDIFASFPPSQDESVGARSLFTPGPSLWLRSFQRHRFALCPPPHTARARTQPRRQKIGTSCLEPLRPCPLVGPWTRGIYFVSTWRKVYFAANRGISPAFCMLLGSVSQLTLTVGRGVRTAEKKRADRGATNFSVLAFFWRPSFCTRKK